MPKRFASLSCRARCGKKADVSAVTVRSRAGRLLGNVQRAEIWRKTRCEERDPSCLYPPKDLQVTTIARSQEPWLNDWFCHPARQGVFAWIPLLAREQPVW